MQCSVGARRTCRSESSPTPESAWAGRVHPGPPATHEHGCSCSDRARRFQIRTSQVAPMATQTAAPLLMDGGRGRTWRRQHTLRVRATGASDAAADRRHQHCAGCARSRQRYTCRRHESHCHPGVARQAPRLSPHYKRLARCWQRGCNASRACAILLAASQTRATTTPRLPQRLQRRSKQRANLSTSS